MKTSILASTLALVASALAAEVTEYLYVTVDENGNTIGGSSTSFFPTTLLTVTRGNFTANGTNSTTSNTYTYYSASSVYSSVTPTILQSAAPVSDAYAVPVSSSSPAPSPVEAAPTTSTTSTSSKAAKPTTSSSEAPQQTDSGSSNSGSSSGSSGAGSSFAQAILAAHNQKRSSHSASPLSWSSTLESYAQNYANKFQCGGSLVHSGGPYGENLALGYSDGPAAVDAWYSEGANYDYSSCSVYDHFTQVIWKSTTQVGCAYKDCGGLYIICSYNPAGNFVGQGQQNLSQ